MKPFLDTGFLLTLLFETGGSLEAWKIARELDGPLTLASLQVFTVENRLQRQIDSEDTTAVLRAAAVGALQTFRWYLEQQVFQMVRLDYEIAINLASQWQKQPRLPAPALILLWPALAVTIRSTHFLSFDPRARQVAQSSGLKLLPAKLKL